MFKAFNDLSNLHKFLIVVLVVVVVYYIYNRSESLESSDNAVIVNKPNNKQDATELKQTDPKTAPVLYDRKTGVVTAASEFVGLPSEILPAWGSESVTNYGKIDRLDDGYNGAMGLNYNMCSKSCCGPQYPPPFNLEEDEMVKKMKDQFVPNNYSCNNAWNNTGCVCLTKKQHQYIGSRGGNAN
jgi:hypothetical protein